MKRWFVFGALLGAFLLPVLAVGYHAGLKDGRTEGIRMYHAALCSGLVGIGYTIPHEAMSFETEVKALRFLDEFAERCR